jgi:hypothetical protein
MQSITKSVASIVNNDFDKGIRRTLQDHEKQPHCVSLISYIPVEIARTDRGRIRRFCGSPQARGVRLIPL